MADFLDAYLWITEHDPESAAVVRDRFAKAYVGSRCRCAPDDCGMLPDCKARALSLPEFYACWRETVDDVVSFVSVDKPDVRRDVMADAQQRETAVELAIKMHSVRMQGGEHMGELDADQLVQDAEAIAKFLSGVS